MTKFTKRQYLAAISANEAAIEAVKAEIEALNVRFEAGEEVIAAWNAANDREGELGQERWAIERRWTQRNWTGADYAFAELVAANID